MPTLVVTPLHNEEHNLLALGDQVAASKLRPDAWVLVDDGSADSTLAIANGLASRLDFVSVVRHENSGGLIGGSAFRAWTAGVVSADYERYDAIMKLDADVDLPPDYLSRAVGYLAANPGVGVVGGVIIGRGHREQQFHVPGPVKLYSLAGYRAVAALPKAVGFDVMDEIAIAEVGLQVVVLRDLTFGLRRAIGASQGLVHGRRRNGQVCRWVGYWPPYFMLHALRYVARRPYLIGSFAMVWGYATAPPGPYPEALRRKHSSLQRAKLRAALKSPIKWVRSAYGLRNV